MKKGTGNAQYKAIDIWKMILAIIMAVYHYNYAYGLRYDYLFPGGYICVDVFFLVTGFFLMKSISENPDISVCRFLHKRFISLAPQYYVALLLATAVYIRGGTTEPGTLILQVIKEALFIHEWGIVKTGIMINSQTWYISAMLFCSIIIFCLQKIVHERKCFFVIIAIIDIICIILCVTKIGNLHIHGITAGHISLGVIRGFIGMCSGILAYKIKDKKCISSIHGFVASAGICFLAIYCCDSWVDFLVIPLSFISVIGLSKVRDFSFKNNKVLRQMSYVLYLNHVSCRDILANYVPGYGIVVYLLVCILFSWILILIERIIRKGCCVMNS